MLKIFGSYISNVTQLIVSCQQHADRHVLTEHITLSFTPTWQKPVSLQQHAESG